MSAPRPVHRRPPSPVGCGDSRMSAMAGSLPASSSWSMRVGVCAWTQFVSHRSLAGGDGVTDVTTLPERLVRACALALPVTGVGLVLMTESGPAGTVAVTDRTAGTMEELQFTLGEGPCVESSATGRPVLQPDLARTGPARWPGFCAGALEAGSPRSSPSRFGSAASGWACLTCIGTGPAS